MGWMAILASYASSLSVFLAGVSMFKLDEIDFTSVSHEVFLPLDG